MLPNPSADPRPGRPGASTTAELATDADHSARASVWDRPEITLPELLGRLDFEPGEHVQHFRAHGDGSLTIAVYRVDALPAADSLTEPGDNYFGINPVRQDFGGGRPADADVVALRTLFADLDFKPGGCGDEATAEAIIDGVSAIVGRPVAVTASGHGLQPLWAVEDGELAKLNREERRVVLRRWGRLVRSVAADVGAGRPIELDSVFDPPRLARIPGSTNRKDPAAPVPVITRGDIGSPITVNELKDRLDAYGITEISTDRVVAGDPVSPRASWMFASVTCGYAASVIGGWASDTPPGRHTWLVGQFVRLSALHRNGCITEADHGRACRTLVERFRLLLVTMEPIRPEQPDEIRDAFEWGIDRAAAMDENALAMELGGHQHRPVLALAPGQIPTPKQAINNRLTTTPTNGATIHPQVDSSTSLPVSDTSAQSATIDQTALSLRVATLRVDREARRILARENAPEVPKPQSLADLLAEPDEEVQYRIDRLLPEGGNALLAAQFKAGKTTLTGNFVRCCVDGGFFLSGFTTLSPPGRVVLIDTEMDKRMIRRWLRDQGIRRTDGVDVVALRGRVAAFNPMDDVNRAEWAERLAGAKGGVLVVDCLRPILDAHGLKEKEDAGIFLIALDALKAEVGASEVLLVHHMGHTGERSRGDSRLRDWPDVEWRLVREGKEGEDAEPNAPRYFSAYGRDVDVPEGRLEFDAATRHLTYRNGNRQEEKAKQISASAKLAMADAHELLKRPNVKLSQNSLIAELETLGHGQTAARKGIRHAVDDGLFLIEDGERGAKMHYLNPSRRDDEQA